MLEGKLEGQVLVTVLLPLRFFLKPCIHFSKRLVASGILQPHLHALFWALGNDSTGSFGHFSPNNPKPSAAHLVY